MKQDTKPFSGKINPRVKDLTNKQFGELRVLYRTENKNGKVMFYCECSCGKKLNIPATNLKTGNTKSCGCKKKEYLSKKATKHGILKSDRKLYFLFHDIKKRCYNKKYKSYPVYGGRGISICDEWLNDLSSFIKWAKESNYKKGLIIDRINPNGNYSPDNCRFVNAQESASNTRLILDSNTSGYKGVSKKEGLNYQAYYSFNRKKLFLGYYSTAKEASLIRDAHIFVRGLWQYQLNNTEEEITKYILDLEKPLTTKTKADKVKHYLIGNFKK